MEQFVYSCLFGTSHLTVPQPKSSAPVTYRWSSVILTILLGTAECLKQCGKQTLRKHNKRHLCTMKLLILLMEKIMHQVHVVRRVSIICGDGFLLLRVVIPGKTETRWIWLGLCHWILHFVDPSSRGHIIHCFSKPSLLSCYGWNDDGNDDPGGPCHFRVIVTVMVMNDAGMLTLTMTMMVLVLLLVVINRTRFRLQDWGLDVCLDLVPVTNRTQTHRVLKGGWLIPLIFPKISQSSRPESSGFPSYTLPLDTPP